MPFGDIANPWPIYLNRTELWQDGVHRQREGGIAGSGIAGSGIRGQGAESVVLSGEYEDDVDNGDFILYTGLYLKIANETADEWQKTGNLSDNAETLRCALFFEQRRFRHLDSEPTGSSRDYVDALLRKL